MSLQRCEPEILRRIFGYVTQASNDEPAITSVSWEHIPQALLQRRLQRAALSKHIHFLMNDGYWSENWCFAYVNIDPPWTEEAGVAVLSAGTFRETEYYHKRVYQLRIFINVRKEQNVRLIATKIKTIVQNCERLGRLIFDVHQVNCAGGFTVVGGRYQHDDGPRTRFRAFVGDEMKKAVREVVVAKDKKIIVTVVDKAWDEPDVVTAQPVPHRPGRS